MFCLICIDGTMINKICKKIGGLSINREICQVKSITTKHSIANETVRNQTCLNNNSVDGGLSIEDKLANQGTQLRSTSTISTILSRSETEAIIEVHESKLHKDS